MTAVLITAAGLAAELESARPPVVLDVRWRLDRPDGRPEYLAGHIPGAVYVDLDHELAAHGRPATEGRHPLPAIEDLQAAARRWGISSDSAVVVYDDFKNFSSARAWWLLRHAGIADVRILDGSLRGWTDAGLPLEQGDVAPSPGDVVLRYGAIPALDIEGAAAFPERGVLLDSRAPDRYRGEQERVDPRPGHIPGALSSPVGVLVDESGRFLSPDALRAHYAALGVVDGVPVAAYCGSGITASHQAAALTIAGFEPFVYPGSFSEWSNSDRPVAVGAEP